MMASLCSMPRSRVLASLICPAFCILRRWKRVWSKTRSPTCRWRHKASMRSIRRGVSHSPRSAHSSTFWSMLLPKKARTTGNIRTIPAAKWSRRVTRSGLFAVWGNLPLFRHERSVSYCETINSWLRAGHHEQNRHFLRRLVGPFGIGLCRGPHN